jgi:hypothetical protein
LNSPNTSGLLGQKMQKRNSLKKIFIIEGNLKILARNAMRAGKTTYRQLRKMTGSNLWVAETVLHTETNALTAVESYCQRKTARCGTGCRTQHVHKLNTQSQPRNRTITTAGKPDYIKDYKVMQCVKPLRKTVITMLLQDTDVNIYTRPTASNFNKFH